MITIIVGALCLCIGAIIGALAVGICSASKCSDCEIANDYGLYLDYMESIGFLDE
jgi:hypothetical protein